MPPKKNNKPSGFVTRAGRKTIPNRIIWSRSQQETMIENEQQPLMVQIVQQQVMIQFYIIFYNVIIIIECIRTVKK